MGHAFSASGISAINKLLDASLKAFLRRKLKEPFPYLILDAGGADRDRGWEGRRQMLAVELANREIRLSWKEFLEALKARGLHGVEFVVSDDHQGLKRRLPKC